MSAAGTLLSAALDPTGWIAIVGLKKTKPPVQKFFAPGDFQGAMQEALSLDLCGYDSYFGTATYLDNTSREARNVQHVKVFKLDLDVAPDDDKKFPSKSAAAGAMVQWCNEHSFPLPVLVDSGWGVHVYWILQNPMNATIAKLYAEKLKAICVATDLKASPESTADIARILRVPGTHNHKVEHLSKPVVLKTQADQIVPVANKDFLAIIDDVFVRTGATIIRPATTPNKVVELFPNAPRPTHLAGHRTDAMTQAAAGFKPKSFMILLERSAAGRGCNQILRIYQHQQSCQEDLWRAGLTVAECCDDRDLAIHEMSKNHGEYNAAATEIKASKTVGPWTCRQFELSWPDGCDGCQYSSNGKAKPKITSPIQLGEYVERSEPVAQLVIDKSKTVDVAPVEYEIPPYPPGYSRGINGGVYADKHDDAYDADLICKHDYYVLNRLDDGNGGYFLQTRYHHPTDGVRDYLLPTKTVGALDALREHLNHHGIMVYDKRVTLMRNYITAWEDLLSAQEQAAKVKTQFGWTDEYETFVIGAKEVTKHGTVRFSPAAPSLGPFLPCFDRKGDFLTWRESFNAYATPGLEQHAFCALTGFGSILLKMLDIEGILFNAYNEKSGTGKTYTLYAAASIWGQPKGLVCAATDTLNAKFHKMGVLNNMPMCIDEVTDMDEKEITKLCLSFTRGKGNDRMQGASNTLRENHTTWAATGLCSSNNSLSEKLQSGKTGCAGELARIIDIDIPIVNTLTKQQADQLFSKLHSNYGWAGELYLQYIYSLGIEKVKDMLAEVQESIDMELGMTNTERFWSAGGAVTLVGGMLAQQAGLHNIDMKRQRQFFCDLVRRARARNILGNRAENKLDFLGEFLNLHMQNTLVVQVNQANQTTTMLYEPRGPLHVRYERDTKTVFIMASELRTFMKNNNENLEAYLDELKRQGVYLDSMKQKRMTAGTNLPPNNCKVFAFKVEDDAVIGVAI